MVNPQSTRCHNDVSTIRRNDWPGRGIEASMDGDLDGSRTAAPIVVAGMHRSGTSLVASVLSMLGVSLGSTLLGADRNNPKGYFEDTDFLRLNREMLAAATIAGEPGHQDWGWTEVRLSTERRSKHFEDARLHFLCSGCARSARRRSGGGGKTRERA